MDYACKILTEHRQRLTPANSPSKEVYGEWETETHEIEAISYFHLVTQCEKIYAANDTFDPTEVSVNQYSWFSDMGLGRLCYDVIKMNQER